MISNSNRDNNIDEIELNIPSFMQTREYEIERQKRIQKKIEEEVGQSRRYKVDKKNIGKRVIKKSKRKNIKGVKILICGVMIIVFGFGIVNNFNKNNEINPNVEFIEVIDIFSQKETIPSNNEFNSGFEYENYNFDYDVRLKNIPVDTKFSIGSSLTEYVINKINSSDGYDYFLKYGEMFGFDPYILIAKGLQESSLEHYNCLPGGSNYNGYGVGICQLETPDGREIIAHNYLTGEDEVMYLTMENAIDLEKNIKMGAMLFQNCLERCNGNIYLALQSYNYSPGMINIIVNEYSNVTGISSDNIKSNLSDFGWLSIVEDVHNNPKEYISSWDHSTYGDKNYIEHVLRYFIGDKTYYYLNGTKYVLNFRNNELIKIDQEIKTLT